MIAARRLFRQLDSKECLWSESVVVGRRSGSGSCIKNTDHFVWLNPPELRMTTCRT